MTNLFDLYEVDRDAFSKGIAVDVDGAVFRVRHAGAENTAYQSALGLEALKHRELFSDVAKYSKQLREIEPALTAAAMFDTVLVGWENVSGRDGSPLEFTRDNWMDLALSCPTVLVRVRDTAERFASFRLQRAQEVADNLGNSLPGTESGAANSPDSKSCEQADSASLLLIADQT